MSVSKASGSFLKSDPTATTYTTAPIGRLPRDYGVYYPSITWQKDLYVRDQNSGVNVFFAAVSEAKSMNDIVLHECDKTGVVVGSAGLRSGKSINLALGANSAEKDNIAEWSEMKSEKKIMGSLKYSFTVPASTSYIQPRRFIWHRKKCEDKTISRLKRMSLTNYEITLENTGEVLALYTENALRAESERGRLLINGFSSTDEEIYILLGTLALCERERRNATMSAPRGGMVGMTMGFGAF